MSEMTKVGKMNDGSHENDASVLEEFHDFYKDVPSLSSHFKLLSKIGEGTFSSVYKALDLNHALYENSLWCEDHEAKSCNSLVALKRIYVTSSPERILNELGILHILKYIL
jgi:cell division control protein 7